MHRIIPVAIFALLSLASLSACTPQPQQAARIPERTPAMLVAQAQQGDSQAQLLLGNYYCENESAKSKGANTLKWWKRAAKGGAHSDPYTRAKAMESIGNYYLALYDSHEDYNPETSRPRAPCTGKAAGESNYSEAKEWFTRCANLGPAYSEGCEAGLANLHHSRNEYEQAYFWRAIVIGGILDDMTLSHDTPISLDAPQLKGTNDLKLARSAARRLPPDKVATVNHHARKWLNERDDSIHAKLVSSLPPKPWRGPRR